MKQGSVLRVGYLSRCTWIMGYCLVNRQYKSERFLRSRHLSTFRKRFERSVLLDIKLAGAC